MSEQETWGQVKQRLIEEFNADPNNILDKSVCRLDWSYEQNHPYFTYKTVLINGVGLTVFKYIELDRGNDYKTIFYDWGYVLILPDSYNPDSWEEDNYWIEDGDYRGFPHFTTVTEAIVAAQKAAIKYLESGIQERQAVVDQLKGKA